MATTVSRQQQRSAVSMQNWQSVVVCVALAAAPWALGHPTALEDSMLGKARDVDDAARWFPAENTGKPSEEDPKKILKMEEEEVKRINLMKDDPLRIPREFVTGSEKKDEKADTTKIDTSLNVNIKQEEDDSVRSKKSPDMRELYFHPHPIEMCIRVHSGQRSPVVCGSPVGEDKQGDQVAPSAPRFASGDYYNPYYLQDMQGGRSLPGKTSSPLYVRVNPEDIDSFKSPVGPGKQLAPGMSPKKMITPIAAAASPALSPAKAGGRFVMRTQPEDDIASNAVTQKEGSQSTLPIQPLRIIPQGPSPSSVVVHKQYYQAAPIPHFHSNLITSLPSATPLRFNCALQPDGAQFVQTYGSPLVRTRATAGLLPLGGEAIPQGMTEMQGYYVNPQGRAALSDDMLQYEDPWSGATFIAGDGQMYKIDDSQARAAADEEVTRPVSSGLSLKERDMLDKSAEKIKQLEEKLSELKRSVDEDDKKKHTPGTEPAKETGAPARELPDTEHKQMPTNKNTKRHSYQHININQ